MFLAALQAAKQSHDTPPAVEVGSDKSTAAVACVTDTVPVPHKHGEAATTMIAMILAKRTLSTTMVIATGGPNSSADSSL